MLQDGWSYPLIIKDVFALYEAFCQDRYLNLQYPRPYRDYINWLQYQDLSQAEAYWRRTLKDFTKPTPLVNCAPHVSSTREDGDAYVNEYYPLSATATSALRSLARQQQLTVNTLLQGAWAILLSRYCGENDVVFGTVVSGRPADLVGSEQMVGNFHNLLPVRVEASPEAQLLPWLRQLQGQQVEMRQFEYSPPRKVRGWSSVPGDQLLFESYLVFENFPVDAYVQEKFTAYRAQVRGMTQTEHPIRMTVWPGRALMPGSEMLLVMSYYRRHFSTATIVRILKDYQAVLERMVADPEQRVGAL